VVCLDRTQFLQLAAEHKDTVFRVALNMLASPDDADDVVQETLIRLLERTEPFESGAHAKNWLIRVAINQCKSVLRSPWRRRRASFEEAAAPDAPQEERELLAAVMSLPEKYRTALYLFYYEGYSSKELAGLLGISVSAVTTRLARARRKLKEKLTEVDNDG